MITKINGLINKIPLIRKIYSKLLNSILNSKKEFIVHFKNIRIFINIKDPLDKLVFYKNGYEEKQINYLCSWIEKNKPNIFIDIGANFGLSNTSGTKKMIAQKRRNYIQPGGFSFNIPKRKLAEDQIIQLHKSKVGDKILKFKNKIVVMKIDVEGYEGKVLLGIKNLIKNNKIFLQIEIFDKNFRKINKFLLEKGFKFINKFDKTSDYFFINY